MYIIYVPTAHPHISQSLRELERATMPVGTTSCCMHDTKMNKLAAWNWNWTYWSSVLALWHGDFDPKHPQNIQTLSPSPYIPCNREGYRMLQVTSSAPGWLSKMPCTGRCYLLGSAAKWDVQGLPPWPLGISTADSDWFSWFLVGGCIKQLYAKITMMKQSSTWKLGPFCFCIAWAPRIEWDAGRVDCYSWCSRKPGNASSWSVPLSRRASSKCGTPAGTWATATLKWRDNRHSCRDHTRDIKATKQRVQCLQYLQQNHLQCGKNGGVWLVGWLLIGCLLVAWLVGWCMVYGGVNQQSPANGYGMNTYIKTNDRGWTSSSIISYGGIDTAYSACTSCDHKEWRGPRCTSPQGWWRKRPWLRSRRSRLYSVGCHFGQNDRYIK